MSNKEDSKQLPVYKVIFNEKVSDGVTSINLTSKPLFGEFVKNTKGIILIATNALNTPSGSVSLLERAVESLDDYLNAGCKDTRKDASDKAKQIYKEFHGKEYRNRNER